MVSSFSLAIGTKNHVILSLSLPSLFLSHTISFHSLLALSHTSSHLRLAPLHATRAAAGRQGLRPRPPPRRSAPLQLYRRRPPPLLRSSQAGLKESLESLYCYGGILSRMLADVSFLAAVRYSLQYSRNRNLPLPLIPPPRGFDRTPSFSRSHFSLVSKKYLGWP